MKKILNLFCMVILSLTVVYTDGTHDLETKYLEFDSIKYYENKKNLISIYDDFNGIPENTKPLEITTNILKIQFGPIDGYASEKIKVGWNNQNVILYIEVLSKLIYTNENISIGSTRNQVISALGEPHLEYDNVIRYQNTDFEVFGILFVIENEIVVKMISFAFV